MPVPITPAPGHRTIRARETLIYRTGRTRPPAKAAGKSVTSFDPSCGAFYWDPTPAANHPMTAAVTPAALSGIAGREVAFDTTTADPDAQIACHWILFGDEQVALV